LQRLLHKAILTTFNLILGRNWTACAGHSESPFVLPLEAKTASKARLKGENKLPGFYGIPATTMFQNCELMPVEDLCYKPQ
jgi:hypothetical protein